MKEFLLVFVSLLMFFAVGVQLDFGDDIDLPDWVEDLMSDKEAGIIDMTHDPVFRLAKTHLMPLYDEWAPPSAK